MAPRPALFAIALAAGMAGGAHGASFTLNGFEAGDIRNWKLAVPTLCSNTLMNCSMSPSGPCASLSMESGTVRTSKSGGFWLRSNTTSDCNSKACTGFRALYLSPLSQPNWSTYTRLVVYEYHRGDVNNVSLSLTASDTGQKLYSVSLSLTANGAGYWNPLYLRIQDMIDNDISVNTMASVRIGLPQPTACVTIFLDDLELVVGNPPSTPTNVSALPAGVSGQIQVTWNESSAWDHFCIFRATYPFSKYPQAQFTDCAVMATPYVDTGLSNGVPYYYKVIAYDSIGDRSPIADAGQNDWAVPVCLQAPGISAYSLPEFMRVMWSSVPSADKYRIFKSSSGSFTYANRYDHYLTQTSTDYYDDKDVTENQQYCYMVAGYDEDTSCEGPPSGLICPIHNMDDCAPPWPIGAIDLTATSSGGSPAVLVGWSRPVPGSPPVDYYEVRQMSPPSSGQVDEDGRPYYTLLYTGVKADTTYTYQVVAVSEGGSCSSYSNPGSVCVLTPPEDATAYACNDRIRVLFKTAGAPGSQYDVYRWDSPITCPPSPALLYTTISATLVYFDDFGVTSGNTCYYRLTSQGTTCESACSAEGSAYYDGTGVCPCAPPGPALLSGLAGSDRIRLTWSRPFTGMAPLDKFWVWEGLASSGMLADKTMTGTVYAGSLTNFTFTATGLSNPEDYCYMVQSIDVSGCSSTSLEACETTGCAPPIPVGDLSLTALPGGSLVITWNKPQVNPLGADLSAYMVWHSSWAASLRTDISGYMLDDGNPATAFFTFTHGGRNLTQQQCYQIEILDKSSPLSCSSFSVTECYACVSPSWSSTEISLDVQAIDSGSIRVSWSRAVDGDLPMDYYVVYRSTDPNCFPTSQRGTVNSDGCLYPYPGAGTCRTRFTFTDTGLNEAEEYFYTIAAAGLTGCSEYYTSCEGATTQSRCRFSGKPTAVATPSSVVLRWVVETSGSTTEFSIWRSDDSTGNTTSRKTKVKTLPGTAREWKDEVLPPKTKRCYVVRMEVDPPCSATSQETCVTTLELMAYPNPVKLSEGPVHFDGLASGAVVEIYTVSGELVRKYTSEAGGLWLWDGRNDKGSTIASGIYLYLIKSGTEKKRGKLVISR